MEPLSRKKMDFEEFCAAAISPYQLEALEDWEKIASTAYGYFEQEGSRAISVDELAQVPFHFHPLEVSCLSITYFHLNCFVSFLLE